MTTRVFRFEADDFVEEDLTTDPRIDISQFQTGLYEDNEENAGTSDLRFFWESLDPDFNTELYVADRVTQAAYSIFMKPDGNGIVIAPIDLSITYGNPQFVEGDIESLNWEGIQKSMFPNGVVNVTTFFAPQKTARKHNAGKKESAEYSLHFVRNMIRNIFAKRSPREQFIQLSKYNPYK